MSFFLESKKRDLSDKSRDGEDSKKVKESDSLSSLPDEVFSDGLNSWELAKLLVNCLKSIKNQVKQLFTFHKEAKESQINVSWSEKTTKFSYIKVVIRPYGKILAALLV